MPNAPSGSQDALGDFRETMAHLVSGVAVVTVSSPQGVPGGLLVSSITSYGTDPATVMLAVSRTARTYSLLREAEEFGVHLLASDQTELAGIFAGHQDDKFTGIAWEWDGTVPRVSGSMAYLRCRTVMFTPFADHAIAVGQVAGLKIEGGEPLVYFKRRLGWHLS
ncbi:flavin reductase family protein [Streptomyces sp. NBC_01298]|uniref:flavin reductase family protein n=1 Tax=Streptomyces sp. NBC_01298 TaxID=2903817 RepID=UPI002E0EEFFA|nr:flavin reductase family protein [Streptomyces sp. NBC_01298]